MLFLKIRVVSLVYHFCLFIFLYYFSTTEDILQMIIDGNHELFGAEKLKATLSLLPGLITYTILYFFFLR